MTIVLTVSLQKGGAGKSITSAITSYLLSQKGYKILAIDLDSQGSLTKILTQENPSFYYDRSILEGIKQGDAQEFIVEVGENLSLIPANDYLALIEMWLYTEYIGEPVRALEKTIAPLKEKYDFIIIDTGPNLGGLTLNALTASDFVIIPWLTDTLIDDALPPFYETIDYIQRKPNPNLKVAGILARIVDGRQKDTNEFLEKLEREHPNTRFRTIIRKNSETQRLAKYGFYHNKNLKQALKDYQDYIEELIERCQYMTK